MEATWRLAEHKSGCVVREHAIQDACRHLRPFFKVAHQLSQGANLSLVHGLHTVRINICLIGACLLMVQGHTISTRQFTISAAMHRDFGIMLTVHAQGHFTPKMANC